MKPLYKRFLWYLQDRAGEAATYRGILGVLASLGYFNVKGVTFDPAESWVALGMLIAGLVGIFLPDKSKGK